MLMEGWSTLIDGSGLYDVEIVQTFKSTEKLGFDLDSSIKRGNVDDCSERLRNMFDKVLVAFLREVSRERGVRPIPALLGDGQAADLFTLFWVVWKRGGYDSVSRNGLWDFVAEECGLDGGVMASAKLVYLKYLNELDQWLRTTIKDRSVDSGDSGIGGKFSLLLLELQKQLKKKDGKLVELECKKNGKYNDLGIDKGELLLPDARDINEVHLNEEKTINDDDDENFCFHDENKVSVLDKTVVCKQVYTSRKRKRESQSWLEMLNWVVEVAKKPHDPAIGRIPDSSKWKDYGSKELWVQALLAREVLLKRRLSDSNTEESLLQKKLKMHPSMYEDSDAPNNRSSEGIRCSERLPSLTKPRLCPCCNSCSASQNEAVSPQNKVASPQNKVATARKAEVENKPKERAHLSVEKMDKSAIDGMSNDENLHKHVSVGPLFQVEVPEWTGVVVESDSKWLGTRMWPPPEKGKRKSLQKTDLIGKGRKNPCSCQLPGSVMCVRFHIAENRMRLKLEIGPLFYHWRFDRMGEEVSLSWTNSEEKRFKDMVRLKPPSLHKCFWDTDVLKFFPAKTKEKLERYYFNVFLVRRRAYQNRVTPKDIDSDDDESEFGCVGDSFGCEALNVPGSKLLVCAENKQCTDF